MSIPAFLPYILAWFGALSGIWALFERGEKVMSKDNFNKLSRWLRNDNTTDSNAEWPLIFISVFDSIFGKKHFAWRCFSRSAIASISTVIVLFSLYVASLYKDPEFEFSIEYGFILVFLGITIILNIIPDYFSLLQTRILINLMPNYNLFGKMLVVIVDLILTFTIFMLGLFIFQIMFTLFLFGDNLFERLSIIEQFNYVLNNLFFTTDGIDLPIAVWLYSTFFTSIWIWLFFISSMVIKTLNSMGIGIKKIGKFFNTKEKPLSSLGFMAMILVTILFAVLPFF